MQWKSHRYILIFKFEPEPALPVVQMLETEHESGLVHQQVLVKLAKEEFNEFYSCGLLIRLSFCFKHLKSYLDIVNTTLFFQFSAVVNFTVAYYPLYCFTWIFGLFIKIIKQGPCQKWLLNFNCLFKGCRYSQTSCVKRTTQLVKRRLIGGQL